MNPTHPCVSILLPVFNGRRFLARAIESALSQTYQDLEIIAVNDGSTDETEKILESFGSKIRAFQRPHLGAYPARNFALSQARGVFIAFLDYDDAWFPEKLSRQVALFESRPDLGLVFGNGVIVDEGMSRPGPAFFDLARPARGKIFKDLVRCNFIPQSSVMVRKACFEKLGAFREIPLGADYHKWLQISLHYQADYVENPVFSYGAHSSNASSDRIKRYTYLLDIFDDLSKTVADPAAVKALERRLSEFRMEFALYYLKEGFRRFGRSIRTDSRSFLSLLKVFWRRLRSTQVGM